MPSRALISQSHTENPMEDLDLTPAPEDTKPRRRKATEPSTVTFYSLATDEPHSFYIMGEKGARDAVTNRLFWTVDADKAELFARHHHVECGRVYREGTI